MNEIPGNQINALQHTQREFINQYTCCHSNKVPQFPFTHWVYSVESVYAKLNPLLSKKKCATNTHLHTHTHTCRGCICSLTVAFISLSVMNPPAVCMLQLNCVLVQGNRKTKHTFKTCRKMNFREDCFIKVQPAPTSDWDPKSYKRLEQKHVSHGFIKKNKNTLPCAWSCLMCLYKTIQY